jgi:hypothetical protein
MAAQRENEPPPAPPIPGQSDPGIRQAVQRLREHGIETCESCEGGAGHAYPEPTVAFYGRPEAGWKAVSICLGYGLPVRSLRRVWDVLGDLIAFQTVLLVAVSVLAMLLLDLFSLRTSILIVINLAMFWEIFLRVRVKRRYFRHVYSVPFVGLAR